MSVRDVIIIGAGPSGLSAAIAAKQRDLDYEVLEQGVLVNSIYRFPPQMVFFTTPELLEIGGLPFVSPFDKPTRAEALKYYRKVADAYDLSISYGETVLSVTRPDAFAVETSKSGERRVHHARNVIMAIGYFDHPVRCGIPGEDLPHVHHYYGEPHPYYRQRVVIVGGGNSAAESALEMFRAGAHVTIVHRAPTLKPTIKYWVRPDIENRIKEGSIPAHFSAAIREIRPASVVIAPTHAVPPPPPPPDVPFPADGSANYVPPVRPAQVGEVEIPADAVFLLTGYRADADLMRRAGVRLNDRDAPVHDPETFETNVSGLFVAGGAIAGVDTGTVFIENGRFHGEKIIQVIASRDKA
ncbi:MAG TPA: NAD(P)-binding domain-containing protein [Vicinamibacterales bacterium]|nr:NAD(P)-binding domain-containing protein [Vicinamibacterales bacterium]